MADSRAHEYEHRCCWNCGADNYHAPEPDEGPRFQAIVVCHEPLSPLHAEWETYSDPPIAPNEWHDVAGRCPSWISADGIFPGTMISLAPRTDA